MIKEIELSKIRIIRNPRQDFNEIEELAKSFKGLPYQPLIVDEIEKGERYGLVDGERRLRALRKIKAEKAECIIIGEKLTPIARLEIQDDLDRHHHNLDIETRDKIWKELWDRHPEFQSQEKFAKYRNAGVMQVVHFQQRINLVRDYPESTSLESALKTEVSRLPDDVIPGMIKKIKRDKLGTEAIRKFGTEAAKIKDPGERKEFFEGETIADGKIKVDIYRAEKKQGFKRPVERKHPKGMEIGQYLVELKKAFDGYYGRLRKDIPEEYSEKYITLLRYHISLIEIYIKGYDENRIKLLKTANDK